MSHKPHDLAVEFADELDVFHRLKQGGGHFVTLVDRYNAANDAIYRIEAELDPSSDSRVEELKKERLVLLDQLSAMVREAA